MVGKGELGTAKLSKDKLVEEVQDYFNQYQCDAKLFDNAVNTDNRKPIEKTFTRKKLEQL